MTVTTIETNESAELWRIQTGLYRMHPLRTRRLTDNASAMRYDFGDGGPRYEVTVRRMSDDEPTDNEMEFPAYRDALR